MHSPMRCYVHCPQRVCVALVGRAHPARRATPWGVPGPGYLEGRRRVAQYLRSRELSPRGVSLWAANESFRAAIDALCLVATPPPTA
jgi:hypothetical protein